MQANTDYRDCKPRDQVIQWFWQVVEDFDAEEKALLLLFVTGEYSLVYLQTAWSQEECSRHLGTSKVPLDGFKGLRGSNGPHRFTIQKVGGTNKLPMAHT